MKKELVLLPKQRRILAQLGENIQLARLRRRLSAEQVSERANVSRKTLYEIERGSESVRMGAYMQVLFVLGFEKDLAEVAGDDVLGRKLQDLGLQVKKRAPKRNLRSGF
ncbi:MAG: helix-turn-helix transcriptional regulator [Bacteroidales bacterium]